MGLKKTLRVLTAAAALIAGGSAQAITPVNESKNGFEINQKINHREGQKKISQSREIVPDGIGGLRQRYYNPGVSPKDYGTYLQATGKQKWTKRR